MAEARLWRRTRVRPSAQVQGLHAEQLRKILRDCQLSVDELKKAL